MKKRLLALLMCVALLLALAACAPTTDYELLDDTATPGTEETDTEAPVMTRPPAETLDEKVEFRFEVVHRNGSQLVTYVNTDQAYLGYALLENGLIGGIVGPYGLYVKTVDDERADESKEEWWCLTKDGEAVNTGVDSTPVEAGATYTFTFTEGYY